MNPFDIFVIVLITLYFLPSIIALYRSCNIIAVILINTFLGWTFIGWLVALILSLTSSNNKNISIINNVQATVGDSNHVKSPNTVSEPPHKQKLIISAAYLTAKRAFVQHKNLILGICFGVLFILVLGFLGRHQENQEFYDFVRTYKLKSRVFEELFDCEALVNQESKYEFCQCLYEYSVKISDEYLAKKNKILTARYDYSHKKTNAFQSLKDEYFDAGIAICIDAI